MRAPVPRPQRVDNYPNRTHITGSSWPRTASATADIVTLPAPCGRGGAPPPERGPVAGAGGRCRRGM